MEKKDIDYEVIEAAKAREIVQEILKFGVNEFQIKRIIKLLSLELFDTAAMKSICKIIDGEEILEKPKIEI